MNEEKEQFEIPEQGSLGLLALGYRGLVAWREKKEKAQGKNANDPRESKEED